MLFIKENKLILSQELGSFLEYIRHYFYCIIRLVYVEAFAYTHVLHERQHRSGFLPNPLQLGNSLVIVDLRDNFKFKRVLFCEIAHSFLSSLCPSSIYLVE